MKSRLVSLEKGFTLLELLISVGIMTVVGTLVVITIQPAEIFRQSRDAQRISDIAQLGKAIEFSAIAGTNLGTAKIVYVSIPKSGGTCPSMLIPLLAGYSYACSTVENFRNIDGTGWVPVDFNRALSVEKTKNIAIIPTAYAANAPLSTLPVDPINSSADLLFYGYLVNGKRYQLITRLESVKYQNKMQGDEGSDATMYEKGSSVSAWADSTGRRGLVSQWTFSEGSGTAVTDSSGNGFTGTITGATWTPFGKNGSALSFDGSGDSMSTLSNNALDTQSNLTVSTWVFANTRQNSDGILEQFGGGGLERGIYISDGAHGGSDDLRFHTSMFSQYGYTTSNVFTSSVWHHVVMVFDGTQTGNANRLKVYVDGVQQTLSYVGTIAATTGVNSGNLTFGNSAWGPSADFDGKIDETRIYNRSLSAAEITALYDSGL